ncbi:MAG TPA: acyl-CoA dehydrogenase family protein [Acidimicrobiales bacterium]|nr:acyl-CoA dehydrogenase family protein [Acidimicrobiales bacterium]
MLIQPNGDQAFLRETTDRFLTDRAGVADLRALRHDPAGFTPDYWRQGAELGWTSLLVDEAHGGGAVSDHGLVDLTLIAYEFGRHAAPGPLIGANLAACALSSSTDAGHLAALHDQLSGAALVSWFAASGAERRGGDTASVTITPAGDDLVLTGIARPVEAGGRATHVVVAGRTGDGLTQLLVPADAEGLTVEPLQSVDLTRRFARLRFDEVRMPATALIGAVGEAGEQVGRQLQMAGVLLAAESVGAMQRAFDMTVEWAFDRYSFGRPLASYQALKHRFADMLMWLEGSHAIADEAAAAVARGQADAVELVSAAQAYIGTYGTELLQECVQLHGGIGITFDHDLHLYLRRVTVNAAVCGTAAEHRQRLADIAEQNEGSAA